LSVSAASLDHIVISPASATIAAGASQAYSAEGFDAFGNSVGDITPSTTFSIAPEGSCNGNLCTANAGGPHTVTGNNGGKTSNALLSVSFVRNPGFETDLSGWNTSGSGTGVTLTRVTGGHSGSWAAKLTNSGTSATTCLLNDSPDWARSTSSGTYTGSLWARADAAGKPLKLRFREYVGSTLVGTATTQVTLTTSWQQVTVTYTVTSPGSTLDFNAYLSSADAPPGTSFYADDVVILRG
jgi:Carbohydrate binding domain